MKREIVGTEKQDLGLRTVSGTNNTKQKNMSPSGFIS